ncbi:MAG: hypothetical protein AB8B99_19870 [Phormidesmis sp.]
MKTKQDEFINFLWLWAAGYPLIVVWGVDFIVSAALRRDMALASEWLPKLFQSVIAALPFVALAVCGMALLGRSRWANGDRRILSGLRFASVTVTVTSVTLWMAYYWDSISAYNERTLGGASIGLGLLILFSPLLLSLLIPIAYWIGVRFSKY